MGILSGTAFNHVINEAEKETYVLTLTRAFHIDYSVAFQQTSSSMTVLITCWRAQASRVFDYSVVLTFLSDSRCLTSLLNPLPNQDPNSPFLPTGYIR